MYQWICHKQWFRTPLRQRRYRNWGAIDFELRSHLSEARFSLVPRCSQKLLKRLQNGGKIDTPNWQIVYSRRFQKYAIFLVPNRCRKGWGPGGSQGCTKQSMTKPYHPSPLLLQSGPRPLSALLPSPFRNFSSDFSSSSSYLLFFFFTQESEQTKYPSLGPA